MTTVICWWSLMFFLVVDWFHRAKPLNWYSHVEKQLGLWGSCERGLRQTPKKVWCFYRAYSNSLFRNKNSFQKQWKNSLCVLTDGSTKQSLLNENTIKCIQKVNQLLAYYSNFLPALEAKIFARIFNTYFENNILKNETWELAIMWPQYKPAKGLICWLLYNKNVNHIDKSWK